MIQGSRIVWLLLWLAAPVLAAPSPVLGDPAPFDLAGPNLQVTVTRAGVTLPIAETPDLSPGDQLWIKADLPPAQSVHYLMVAAFLQGATNPPPKSWFHRSETWGRGGRDGMRITVPADAQQVIVLLAPETGGDFNTLVDAIRGRPGAFVRASQDLNQASLDRSRLNIFMAAVQRSDPGDPDRLKTVSPLLARSLAIKLEPDCLQKPIEAQAACLTQGQDSLVLNDGHSTSIVEALTSGSAADLAVQLSATPQAGFGLYSPYVAAVLDIARILGSFQTARYQYIPALASARDDRLALLLNTPPSFHDPMSVLVAALPAVEPAQPPPLQPPDAKALYCAERSDLVLPVEGAPLVYSTRYAHDMVLRVKTVGGRTVDLPVKPDAEKGGFVADTTGFSASDFGGAVEGSLHGVWGFQPFDGPVFHLRNAHAQSWRLADEDRQSLIVGRDDTVHLEGSEAACVQGVGLQQGESQPEPLDWKAETPDRLAVVVPLANAEPGALSLKVKQYGMKDADTVSLQAFAQAGRLDGFSLHAGDLSGVLKGSRLDEVDGLSFRGIDFRPDKLASAGGDDTLTLVASDTQAALALKAGQTASARVKLKDGRTVNLKTAVAPPRPRVTLIGKSLQPVATAPSITLRLTDVDELPQGATLTFSVRAQEPASFSGGEAIEVAAVDGSAAATLTPSNGLTVADAHVLLATLDTGKAFTMSAFGPLQFRVVENGAAGDWQPLATLVRLPVLRELKCREGGGRPCELTGSNLFLIDSVSGDPGFDHAVKVPDGFPGYVLSVPHAAAGRLYIRLHDDPTVINQAAFSLGDHPQASRPQAAVRPAGKRLRPQATRRA